MIVRTVVFPVSLLEEEKISVRNTLVLYSKAWSECVNHAWKMDKPNSVYVHKATYSVLKEKLGLLSQYLCSARNRAVEAVKSTRNLAKKKRVSKPTLGKRPIPIRLDRRTMSFDKLRETVSLAMQGGRIKVSLHWHKQAEKYKDWTCKAGEIGIDHQNRFVLRLIFEKEKPTVNFTGKVIGIDRGIKRPVVTSGNRFFGRAFWKERERKFLSLRTKLQSKGTKSARRHLKKLSCKLRRFKTDCDRVLAKKLFLTIQLGDVVVLENLTHIRSRCGDKGKANKEHRRRMGRWSFRRLENSVRNMAELRGVKIHSVEPNNTSRMCSNCKIVKKSNRITQSHYECSCGLKLNADLNAARNIKNLWYKASGFVSWLSVNQPIVSSTCLGASF